MAVLSVEDRLDAILETGVPGVVVLADGPSGRTETAAGLANLETGEAMRTDHRFRIGSVTKVFVAPLVLQLVDEGLLELDGDAAPFVPGVTVRQLLNHTSGLDDLGQDLVELFEPFRRDPTHRMEADRREQLAQVLERPRLFAPGEGWAYHGSNYFVLGLIVEATTGTSLRDALRQRILAPLGLDKTDLVEGALRGDDCARGYLPAENPLIPGTDGPVDLTEIDIPFFSWAGGGLVSTAGEVAAMLRAQLGGGLLPDRLRTEMLTAVDSDWPETDRYGLGIGEINAIWRRERSTCGPAWGHLGFALGYMAIALSSEDGQRQVVLLANYGFVTEESESAFFDAAGRLMWDLYCSGAAIRAGRS